MKQKLFWRRYRTTGGHFGWMLFRPAGRTYFVLSIRPDQRRVVLRLLRSIIGFSWWPVRFWNKGALLAEWRATMSA